MGLLRRKGGDDGAVPGYDIQEKSGGGLPIFRIVLVLVTLLTVAGVVVYAYKQGYKLGQASRAPAPVVKAPKQPDKVRPTKVGGLKVPDKDKTVYNSMAKKTPQHGAAAKPGSAKMVAGDPAKSPAKAMPDMAGKTPAPATKSPPDMAGRTAAPATKSPPDTAGRTAAPATKSPPDTAGKTGAPATKTPPGKAGEKGFMAGAAKAAQKFFGGKSAGPGATTSRTPGAPDTGRDVTPPKTAELIGPFRVQLGSYRSQDMAIRVWSRLQKRHRKLLGNMNLIIEMVKLGRKKRRTMYRMQAGPLASEKAARAMCRKLKRRGLDCLLVRS